MRMLIFAAALAACACGPASEAGSIPVYGYEVVHVYPHDTQAFTEGLFYLNGFLYEGTGQECCSDIRKVKLETGEVVQRREPPIPGLFGEGIIAWRDRLYEMTWRTERGFVYDLATFQQRGEFTYPGEGWGFTQDGKRIIMSDGTAQLRFWDPENVPRETGRITVTADGAPVQHLNELEYIKGEIYANIWETDRIARINPANGKVTAWIDLTGLLNFGHRTQREAELNGIAYDAKTDRLFVTGKLWANVYEIKLVKR
jgi:glutaminyl-peptide cyclotransferase